jgi:hypothetical protein
MRSRKRRFHGGEWRQRRHRRSPGRAGLSFRPDLVPLHHESRKHRHTALARQTADLVGRATGPPRPPRTRLSIRSTSDERAAHDVGDVPGPTGAITASSASLRGERSATRARGPRGRVARHAVPASATVRARPRREHAQTTLLQKRRACTRRRQGGQQGAALASPSHRPHGRAPRREARVSQQAKEQ